MRRPRVPGGRALARAAAFAVWIPAVLPSAAQPAAAQALPRSSLAVQDDGAWRTWWRSTDAPQRWSEALPMLVETVEWQALRAGVHVAELELAAAAPAWRLRIVLLRIRPEQFRLALVQAVRDAGTRGAWSVEAAPADAVFALNAGQFTGGRTWGWLVRDGREVQPPGTGALTMALVIDTAGGARLLPVDSIAHVRGDRGIAHAFQSYPALLRDDGVVPAQLAAHGRGVDVVHRDTRLAIGELRDGRLLIALTRFAALGEAGGGLPFGPTTPEMAALMGALGCREAMLLDGGLSAQLVVRDTRGVQRTWKGWRRVPLALVGSPDVPGLLTAH